MKIIISLAVLFAFLCNAQALNTYLEATVQYAGSEFLEGELIGKMIGNHETFDFVLKPRFTSERVVIKYMYNFPDYVQSISFTWKSESSTPIEIKPLIVSWPSFGQGLVKHVFESDKKQLKNGETAIFKKA